MKKTRSQALSTKKKAKSLTVSRVNQLKQTKKVKKTTGLKVSKVTKLKPGKKTKKATSLKVSKVTRLKPAKKINKVNGRKKKTANIVIDLEKQRENWRKQRRDYWKRRFRRLAAK